MLDTIRSAATALFVGLLVNAPLLAQTPETVEQVEKKLQELRAQQAKQAELKKAAELLDQLMKQAKEREAAQAKPGAQIPANPAALGTQIPTNPAPANPVKPVSQSPQVQATSQNPRPGASAWSVQQVPDTVGAIKGLTLSRDPKIAAAAKELLELLTKASPVANPPAPQNPYKPEPQANPKPVELKFEGGFFLMNVGGGESSLKLSVDGKKAAVTGIDGTVTVYDVTTGKELMKFPAKR